MQPYGGDSVLRLLSCDSVRPFCIDQNSFVPLPFYDSILLFNLFSFLPTSNRNLHAVVSDRCSSALSFLHIIFMQSSDNLLSSLGSYFLSDFFTTHSHQIHAYTYLHLLLEYPFSCRIEVLPPKLFERPSKNMTILIWLVICQLPFVQRRNFCDICFFQLRELSLCLQSHIHVV